MICFNWLKRWLEVFPIASLQTGRLSIANGAAVSAGTFGQGNAGNVQVTADTIILDGTGPNEQFSSGIFTASFAGQAGDIFITANRLRLDNRAVISAVSAGADGGNITINIRDLLLMRQGSLISATAGAAQQSGNGGNITINALRGFLVSAPNENNDITANAFSGSGGRITINAQGVYWFTPRSRSDLVRLLNAPPFEGFRLPTNDIIASSELGVSGTITLNTPNVDPSRGLSQLPQNLIDSNRILANSCIVRDAASSGTFIITGTGGLPIRPGDASLPTFPTGEVRSTSEPLSNAQSFQLPGKRMTEAQGIYQLPGGQVILSWECPR